MSGVRGASVSVVIPCYNGERYLSEALESILGQSRPPDEVIVVDDGSTDRSAAIAAGFGAAVRVLGQENRGESVARNRGIEAATGDWVAFCDADDLWAKTKLEAQLALADHEAVAVSTRTLDRQDWPGGVELVREEPEPTAWFDFALEIGAPFQISSLIVRRRLPLRFDEQIRYGEDLIYLLNLMLVGKVARVDQALTTYRMHRQSQSRQRRLVMLEWHRACDDWLRQAGGLLTQSEVERGRRLASQRIVVAARAAFYSRDWESLELVEKYAREQVRLPGLVGSLPVKRLPSLVYAAWDRARALVKGAGAA